MGLILLVGIILLLLLDAFADGLLLSKQQQQQHASQLSTTAPIIITRRSNHYNYNQRNKHHSDNDNNSNNSKSSSGVSITSANIRCSKQLNTPHHHHHRHHAINLRSNKCIYRLKFWEFPHTNCDDERSTAKAAAAAIIKLCSTNTILSMVVGIILLLGQWFVPIIMFLPSPSFADIGWDDTTQVLRQCKAKSNCVSSSYKEPPNRYVSPLRTLKDQDIAFESAIKNLQQRSSLSSKSKSSLSVGMTTVVKDIVPNQYYIHLVVPGTVPGSLDDIELQFTQSNTVNIRCDAQVTVPYAPFCIKKNCINGAQDQRDRLQHLAIDVLGIPFADEKQMKSSDTKWTPIFFNADRVPDMILYDDE